MNYEKTMKEWDDSVPDGIKYLSAENRVLTRKVRELESENDAMQARAEKAEADCKRYAEINELDSAEWLKEKARAERAEAEVARLNRMVERLMRMVEDRFVLLGNSLDGHLQDCNCAVFLSSRMERDAWSELCYEWHGIYSDWQSANGHQAGKVSENEGSEG